MDKPTAREWQAALLGNRHKNESARPRATPWSLHSPGIEENERW